MAAVGEIPSNLPQKPTNLPSSSNTGLSVGSTVGIGLGIALLVILGALGAWIFARRRRRTWAQKRKTQGDPEVKGDTPNEEITKKALENDKSNINSLDKEMGIDGAVEIGDGGQEKTNFGPINDAQKHELPTDKLAYEMPSAAEPVEIGEGNRFAAELEGSAVAGTAASTEKIETYPVDPTDARK